jgi:hypothetical protein
VTQNRKGKSEGMSDAEIRCEIERVQGMGPSDSIYIHINGGFENGGLTVRVDIPVGHSADSVMVETSSGEGWEAK